MLYHTEPLPQGGFLSNKQTPDFPVTNSVCVSGNYFLMEKLSPSHSTDWLSTPIASRGTAAITSTPGFPILQLTGP